MRFKKVPRKLTGGPFDGEIVYLNTPKTLTFTVRGMTGYYDSQGFWIQRTKKGMTCKAF